jgi:hypothetical protein
LLIGVGVTRQWAAFDELVHRAGQIPEVEAVILIGSLASATADAVSDVDAIVMVHELSFPAAHRQRHALHAASVPVCWDHLTDPPSEVAAHKWIDDNGVLVEVLLATTSGPPLRVAEPARVVLGDPAVLSRTRRRPPIRREEMTGSTHPIEAAYDRLKESVRHPVPLSGT